MFPLISHVCEQTHKLPEYSIGPLWATSDVCTVARPVSVRRDPVSTVQLCARAAYREQCLSGIYTGVTDWIRDSYSTVRCCLCLWMDIFLLTHTGVSVFVCVFESIRKCAYILAGYYITFKSQHFTTTVLNYHVADANSLYITFTDWFPEKTCNPLSTCSVIPIRAFGFLLCIL